MVLFTLILNFSFIKEIIIILIIIFLFIIFFFIAVIYAFKVC